MKSARMTLIANEREINVDFAPPMQLSTLLAQCGADVEMPCGGRRSCLKCKVFAQGMLSAPDAQEQALLKGAPHGLRYACMAMALGDIRIEPLRALGNGHVQTEGDRPDFPLEPWADGYGIAVDIGTTTVAAYLYRLTDGVQLAAQSALNPQAAFGADVIARIGQAMQGEGTALAEAICNCIDTLARALCVEAGLALNAISAMVLTGNTAMLTLLCSMDPTPLSAMPFEPDCLFGAFMRPPALSLPDQVKIYLPRCIAAYVGADITTALMAAGLYRDGQVAVEQPHLFVDVGTNGEIALAASGRLLCCATAAGPAFEGAGISCGMMAKTGAIDRVDYRDGSIEYTVLGGGEATGICGSGLIDAIAALLDAGILDETGILDVDEAFFFPGSTVSINQKDIRAVQLAKAAICAGMTTLMAEAGLTADDIAQLIIAGGFGSHIRIASAQRIGLIPMGLGAKARAIGNGAGMGAAMLLLSEPLRVQSESIGALTQVVELSTDPRFMDAYVEGMFFPTE